MNTLIYFMLGYIAIQLTWFNLRMRADDLETKLRDEEYEKRMAIPYPIINVGGQLRVGTQQEGEK
jgi:uncharacterized membrane protein YcaP (DUF421 family)